MRKPDFIILSIIICSFLNSTVSVHGQTTKYFERGPKEGLSPELHQEIREFVRQNILPVMLDRRRDFESELISEEKAIIVYIRTRIPQKIAVKNRKEPHEWTELSDTDKKEIKSARVDRRQNWWPMNNAG